MALALAPAGVSLNNQAFRPTTNGRIAFSQRLCRLSNYAASWLKGHNGRVDSCYFVGIFKGSPERRAMDQVAYIESVLSRSD